jgi:hypothetical protein
VTRSAASRAKPRPDPDLWVEAAIKIGAHINLNADIVVTLEGCALPGAGVNAGLVGLDAAECSALGETDEFVVARVASIHTSSASASSASHQKYQNWNQDAHVLDLSTIGREC